MSLLVRASAEIGIDVQVKAQVKAIKKVKNSLAVEIGGDSVKVDEADLVVHGAGRVAAIDELDLERAGVVSSPKGIVVNDYLQSVSNPKVYAAGDAADSGPPLTPVAMREGEIVGKNLLGKRQKRPEDTNVPSVVFTIPPLASVGLAESAAKQQGLAIEVKFKETPQWFHHRRVNEKFAAHKILIEKDSGRILGAHVFGIHADEIINVFALAIQTGLKTADLKEVIYAYPTVISSIQYMV